ncbi:carbonic anhydrase [Actinomadura formosensis]|uniref:carbonic anhydrase n=1 Tax=Actinomadura formosensis TaxID=60706 RepID=UPI000837A88B|nr:carbonic anhydrase [Actinomadura formosensis]
MKEIYEGARAFRHRIGGNREHYAKLASGQSPKALFIACSDSRVVPAHITGVGPGELFELRTAGNIVPPYRPRVPTGEAATIEYAVQVLKVGNIVVCGHSHCGAVGALVRGDDLSGLPEVAGWLEQAKPGLNGVLGTSPSDPALPESVQRNVIAQVKTLYAYPHVRLAIEDGRLRIHGWYYEVDSGTVWGLDATGTTFHRL